MNRSQRRCLTATAAVIGAVIGGGIAGVAFSGSASAQSRPATVSFNGRELTYQAAQGQANHLTLSRTSRSVPNDDSPYGSSEYTFRFDDTVSIAFGAGAADNTCTHPSGSDLTVVVCTYVYESGQDPETMAYVKLDDKNDTLRYHDISEDTYDNVRFSLGSGADTYTSDADRKDGSGILAGPGNDTVTTGLLAGDLSGVMGGTGNDTIHGQGDSAGSIAGGAGNDQLYGAAGAQSFDGGPGNDVVRAGAGKDSIVGGQGNDKLYGGAGADTIHGNAGNDKLYGGAGTDTLIGGPGKDVIKQN